MAILDELVLVLCGRPAAMRAPAGRWNSAGLARRLDTKVRRWNRIILVLAGIFSASVCLAQPNAAAESAIKAAFLYKFSDYIQWPPTVLANADTPIVFGVLGADQVAENLRQVVAGRRVNGHPMVVRELQPGDTLSGIQVLFIGRSADGATSGALGASDELPVLTVTESKNWNGSDSVINFVIVGDKVRFDVSLKSATRNKLKISTRLLSVARHVVADS